jgi:hypothetical protein
MSSIFRPTTVRPSIAAVAAAVASAGGAPEIPIAMRSLPTVYTVVRGGKTIKYPLNRFTQDTTIVFRPSRDDDDQVSRDVAALLKSTGITTAKHLSNSTDIVMECRLRPFNLANYGRHWKLDEKNLADREKAWVETFGGIFVPEEDVLGYAKLLLERSLILKATGGWKEESLATKARIRDAASAVRVRLGGPKLVSKKKTKAPKSMKPK